LAAIPHTLDGDQLKGDLLGWSGTVFWRFFVAVWRWSHRLATGGDLQNLLGENFWVLVHWLQLISACMSPLVPRAALSVAMRLRSYLPDQGAQVLAVDGLRFAASSSASAGLHAAALLTAQRLPEQAQPEKQF
jgi:hypothetical protein